MTRRHRIPWPGMVLAALACAALLTIGLPPVLVIGLTAVWFLTLWMEWFRPAVEEPRAPAAPRPDFEALNRAAMRAAIEPLGQPVILLDNRRIIAANQAARHTLGAHITGQDSRLALRHPDAVKLLESPEGGTATLRGLTAGGSLWQLTRRPIDEKLSLIEFADRTAEADIGRAHTDFVANASHELRTPLASIIGYVETLSEAADGASGGGALDPGTTARFLAIVLREARRIQSLVADLMSLSQLEAEKHDLPKMRIDLGQLAARVVGEFTGPGAPTAGRLALARPETAINVVGDAKQLEQLLRNLVDNAFKYGDSEQPVSVELKRGGRGSRMVALLTVTDRGAGIAPEHVPHLTRRFYRTDPGRSRQAGGTGLGLAIVKHVVERHRGRLDIVSKLGEGTSVTIQLPLAERRAAETTPSESSLGRVPARDARPDAAPTAPPAAAEKTAAETTPATEAAPNPRDLS